MKKGFTLIELLAVILILGIIAVIAYSGVNKIIEAAKKNAFKVNAENIANAAEKQYSMTNLSDSYYYIDGTNYNAGNEKLPFKGANPDLGTVDITEDGSVAIVVYDGIYCATRAGDEEVVSVSEVTVDNCSTYNIINTNKTWTEIAIDNNVVLQDLLDLNEETDSNSSTSGRDIKIPVMIVEDAGDLAFGDLIYTSEVVTDNYVPATTKLTVSENDDGTAPIDLGFDFNFGGTIYNTIYPSVNGYIAFTEDDAQSYRNLYIASWFTYPIIAAYWTDLTFDFDLMPTSGIYYTIGVEEGKNYVLVEWQNVLNWNCDNQDATTTGTFEIKLYEDGSFKIYYQDVEFEGTDYKNGLDSTVGFFSNSSNYETYSLHDNQLSNGLVLKYSIKSGSIPTNECFAFYAKKQSIASYNSQNVNCSKNVIIPSTFNGQEVKGVSVRAFYRNAIESVVIPNTVTSVGKLAFYDNVITSATLSSNLISIGDYAFESNLLTSIDLQPATTTYGDSAFASNKLTTITIPNTLSSISDALFASNLITTINFPNTITYIGYNAFAYNLLTTVNLPTSLTTIDSQAFVWNQLTSLNIPSSVTYIGSNAFRNNEITGAVNLANVTTIGMYAFNENDVTSFNIPSLVGEIPDSAFRNNAITTINIPSGVTSIGYCAFCYNSLTSVTIPNTVLTIADAAFTNNNLTNINIPSSVTSIGYRGFGWNNISTIIMGRTGTVLGEFVLGDSAVNLFRTAYNAGGAGTYSGSQYGTWTKQ